MRPHLESPILSNPFTDSIMAASNAREQSSLSNYEDVIVKHHDIAFTVDFSTSTVRGSVSYTAVRRREGVSELVLDTNHLVIESCSIDGAWVRRRGWRGLRLPLRRCPSRPCPSPRSPT